MSRDKSAPAQHLLAFRTQSARTQRANRNNRIVQALMADHGYTDRGVLHAAWGVAERTSRASVARLIRDRAIREITLPASRRRLLLWTREGAAEAAGELGRPVYAPNAGQIGRTLIDHSLAVQLATVQICDERGTDLAGESAWFEWRVPARFVSQAPLQVDAALMPSSEHPLELIELELTAKTADRLRARIEQLVVDLERCAPDAILHYMAPAPIARKLRAVCDQIAETDGIAAKMIIEGTVEVREWP